jgi:hypothetical protein
MNKLSYDAAAVSVRQEFADAHSRFWEKLPAAGTWWTGAERVAIAAEVRNAVVEEMGTEAMVEAAGVATHSERTHGSYRLFNRHSPRHAYGHAVG